MQYIEIFKKAILLMRRLAALTLAAFMTFLSVLTLGIDALSAGKRHPEVSKVNVLLIGAAERSQGITTDGKYYYFSSKWGLTKSELDGKTRVKSKPLAIPQQLKDVCDAWVEQRLADAVDHGDAGAREQAFEEFHV